MVGSIIYYYYDLLIIAFTYNIIHKNIMIAKLNIYVMYSMCCLHTLITKIWGVAQLLLDNYNYFHLYIEMNHIKYI